MNIKLNGKISRGNKRTKPLIGNTFDDIDEKTFDTNKKLQRM